MSVIAAGSFAVSSSARSCSTATASAASRAPVARAAALLRRGNPLVGRAGFLAAPAASRRGLVVRADMNDILAQLFGGGGSEPQMVTPEEAIVGRSTPLRVSAKHFITGQPMQAPFPEGNDVAVFATGCFWGTEKGYWRMPGVVSTAVGYINGFTENPTYEEVCSGQTGHTEAVQVVYDPKQVSYSDLLRLYFESHNPTQGMGQGNDRGTQYRSGIYTTSPEQKALAEAAQAAYQKELTKNGLGEIRNEIVDAPLFYYAEDYHQQYLAKPGARPYCSAQPTGVSMPDFSSWCPAGMEAMAPKIPAAYWDKYAPRPGCTIGFPNEQVTLSSL